MSKNFEEEYKALANEELPDLWNRIEAGLTPKTTDLAEEEHKEITEHAKENTERQPEEKQKKGQVVSFLYRYRTVAVAALCVIVILPAVFVIGRSGGSKSGGSASDSAPMEMNAAVEESWDEAEAVAEDTIENVKEDFAEDVMEDGTEEKAAGAVTSADAGDAVQESLLTDEEAESGSASDAFSRAQNGMNTLPADMAVTEAEKKMKDEASDLSDTKQEAAAEESREESVKVYEKVTVKVTGTENRLLETDSGLFSEVKMKVIKDPSGELSEGLEITVGIAVTSSKGYFTGEEYTVDISYSPDRECPYRTD